VKLLVTGASGFIGGAIVRRARARGWDVRGTGRRPLSDPGYTALDLTQPLDLEFQPDVVVHAAARSSPWGTRREFEAQNVTATRHVVDFCTTHGRPHLIYISTGAVVYRPQHQLALTEEALVPAEPINEYARAKHRGELLVQAYRGDTCILRPRAVFGPGDTVVFPRILRALARGRLPRIGSDQPVMGDLIFIDTLADYVLRAAERRATGIYNVSNNEPVEIYAFLDKLCAELGLPVPSRPLNASTGLRLAGAVEMIYRLLPFLGEPPLTRFGVSVFAYSKTFDVSRALRDLGPPSVSLADGLKQFIAWQRTQSAPAQTVSSRPSP
jgi:nucleoside-diphosphate-sugar epimerase